MTHSEAHHTNYSLLKKKQRCRDVNKQRNTNNMHIPLLFTIKRSLSIWWKRSVYLNIISTPRSLILSHTSGSTSTTSSTRGWYEVITSGTTTTSRHCEVLQAILTDPLRYYERYHESLRGTTSSTRRHYEVLRAALRVTMSYQEKFKVQQLVI